MKSVKLRTMGSEHPEIAEFMRFMEGLENGGNKMKIKQKEMSYIENVAEAVATERLGIHISVVGFHGKQTEISLKTDIPDKGIMLEVLSEILRKEGFIVALGE